MSIYEQIASWDSIDPLGLIDFISKNNIENNRMSSKWNYSKEHNMYVLYIEIHTGGHYGKLISSLQKNSYFFPQWHTKWEIGGHYYFEIAAYSIGYQTVSEYCSRKGVSRQSVHQSKDKFNWITISPNKQLIKPI